MELVEEHDVRFHGQRALTIAIRCFCPPESFDGYSSALSCKPERAPSSFIAAAFCLLLILLFTSFGPAMMFSRTVRLLKG